MEYLSLRRCQRPIKHVILNFFALLANNITELGLNITRHNLFTDDAFFYRKDLHMNLALQKLIKLGQTNEEITNDMTEEEMAEYLLVIVRGIVLDWCVNNGDQNLAEMMDKFMKRVLLSVCA
ncbi:hypothetical protein [Bacillus sp. V59.32b]|uniref:hypothetical protein n=1 Tax=Bacillus sp. V59.32b TaxID=1758642 RepID=UPI000E3EBC0D|nr:hypothetical protein [Bacillus sp. V59.32b]RFU68545.1 hypothetical protein D0463_04555 [Bacillus sp. V59.32b]